MINKFDIISGGKFEDKRGSLKFFNTINFSKVKRFYEVNNSTKNPIRAFHGHMKEEKFVYAVAGKSLLCLVKLTDKNKPSTKSKVYKINMSDDNPQIIHIPKGYANGFKSLTKNSRLIFFSTLSVKNSEKDDYRFDQNYWGKEIWE